MGNGYRASWLNLLVFCFVSFRSCFGFVFFFTLPMIDADDDVEDEAKGRFSDQTALRAPGSYE